MSEYGAAFTPRMIDAMPNKEVELYRLIINAKARQAKKKKQKDEFYAKAGVRPVI